MPFLDMLYVYDANIDYAGDRDDADFTIGHKGPPHQLPPKLRRLVDEGYIFRRMVVTCHGYPGAIKFGTDTLYPSNLINLFANQGFEKLFMFPGSRIMFNGCEVAAEPGGVAFLLTAAKIFLRLGGGTASGSTSDGHQFPIPWVHEGHLVHFSGGVVSVTVAPGGNYMGANIKRV